MKIRITKLIGDIHGDELIGTIHLRGVIDTTACGIADEDYDFKKTSKPIDCETCKTYLDWAKEVAKIKS
jgi:hypothetical protein